ncbi:AAA family ATPase, partial [Candidatus Peregrinibacteria bacterium]|nr:AAA family ATPase [Candidatus Peregrinibacteria bacterium]
MYQYVGLTGLMGSGKGEIVKMLQGRGFEYVSLSDMVRAEATSRGLENTRENLQNIGNELRSSGGAGVLGAKVRERILGDSEGKNWVIDGIRNPVECLELRELEDFQMIGVHASDEILITRMLDRNRDGAQVTKEQLEERLKRGKGIGEPPEGQQVSKCLDMADFFVINEGSIEDLHKKVEHFIKLWKGEDRPTFDEIFMEVAYTWAKRATCLRRRVGAV